MGRTVVSDVESGRIDRTCLATIRQIAAAVGLSVDVGARGLGADIDRVLDERHAMLLGTAARWLTDLGWKCVAEVSYSEFGERGSVDLLAWHQPSSSLLVIEVKTELASVEATLRKHDEKVRLAARIAAERFHWSAVSVSGLLVLPDDRRERRRVDAHASVLEGAYPVRSYSARRWCRSPSGRIRGLLFLPDLTRQGLTAIRRRRERVRVNRSSIRRSGGAPRQRDMVPDVAPDVARRGP